MRARILNALPGALLAFGLGAMTGVVTTFAHRSYPIQVGVTLPVGLVVGLLIVFALLAGFRLVFESRVPAVAAAIGIAVAIAVLAVPGSGGSLLIVDDPVGYVWAIGPVLISVAAVAWPRSPRRPPDLPGDDDDPVSSRP